MWRADPNGINEQGKTEFIRAVLEGTMNLADAEALPEYKGTNINIQAKQGRWARHWACAKNFSVMVGLCISVPECNVGSKDNGDLTAFDISNRSGNTRILTLFYRNLFENEPRAVLLRVLAGTAEPAKGNPIFPGLAMFNSVKTCNVPLMNRGINLGEKGPTARQKRDNWSQYRPPSLTECILRWRATRSDQRYTKRQGMDIPRQPKLP